MVCKKMVYGALALTLVCVGVGECLCFFELPSASAANLLADIMELCLAAFIGIAALLLMKSSFLKYVTLGFSLALICWALGELYSLSYERIIGGRLPYPSVADFGFLGFYLMVSSSLGIMKKMDSEDVHKGIAPYFIFLLLAIPAALLFCVKNSPIVNISNFLYGFLNALIMYQALILVRLKIYPFIIAGVLLAGSTGMIFMISINIFPACIHCATLLFPVCFATILLGILKNNGDES